MAQCGQKNLTRISRNYVIPIPHRGKNLRGSFPMANASAGEPTQNNRLIVKHLGKALKKSKSLRIIRNFCKAPQHIISDLVRHIDIFVKKLLNFFYGCRIAHLLENHLMEFSGAAQNLSEIFSGKPLAADGKHNTVKKRGNRRKNSFSFNGVSSN